MEGYIKKISFLGENIQTIRKHRGMKQQELADKIGINMQSLSKIERGLNYPAYETLEKIMEVLDVTPNELLSGEWKYVNQSEKEVCQFLRTEERLNAELKHGHYDNFFDSVEEWLDSFEVFSIYQVLPEILTLWNLNTLTTAKPKKKQG